MLNGLHRLFLLQHLRIFLSSPSYEWWCFWAPQGPAIWKTPSEKRSHQWCFSWSSVGVCSWKCPMTCIRLCISRWAASRTRRIRLLIINFFNSCQAFFAVLKCFFFTTDIISSGKLPFFSLILFLRNYSVNMVLYALGFHWPPSVDALIEKIYKDFFFHFYLFTSNGAADERRA